MIRLFLISLLICSNFVGIQESKAMLESGPMLEGPENFPGHTSRKIEGFIEIPDHFNPQHFQQSRSRGESACTFNSFLAGIMHSPYGREQIGAMIESQDQDSVTFRLAFPDSKTMEKYRFRYDEKMQNLREGVDQATEIIKEGRSQASVEMAKEDLEVVQTNLKNAPLLWEKALILHKTSVKIPKKFVRKEDGRSFPHDNPDWVNLLQQAYMIATKNEFLYEFSDHTGYTADEEITDLDAFGNIPLCFFSEGVYKEVPSCLNYIEDSRRTALDCIPLIPIPLKKIHISTDEKSGIDLQASKDVKAEIQPDASINYTPLPNSNIVEFAHRHGLTKDILMASNVLQFSSAGHDTVLVFGDGKVHYYDNVYYPEQESIYGNKGPIYEEAKFFQGQSIEEMEESDFLKRLFQEIHHRKEQVAKIRSQESSPTTEIKFFKSALVSDEKEIKFSL
jgi:hypothetical protein